MFIEAKDDGSGGDNWTTGAISHAKLLSPPTNQQPVFLQVGCLSCCPTNSVKALKGKYRIPWTCLPQAHLWSSNFVSLTISSCWLPWRKVATPLISPLMPVPHLGQIDYKQHIQYYFMLLVFLFLVIDFAPLYPRTPRRYRYQFYCYYYYYYYYYY